MREKASHLVETRDGHRDFLRQGYELFRRQKTELALNRPEFLNDQVGSPCDGSSSEVSRRIAEKWICAAPI
jgi:hypothetical protein